LPEENLNLAAASLRAVLLFAGAIKLVNLVSASSKLLMTVRPNQSAVSGLRTRSVLVAINPNREFVRDALLLLAVAQDIWAERRVHRAYAISLPLVVSGQILALWLYLARPAWWVEFAQRLF
jgi:hypothetical protein